MSEHERMLAVAVGNSRVRWGVFSEGAGDSEGGGSEGGGSEGGGSEGEGGDGGGELIEAHSVPNDELASLASALRKAVGSAGKNVEIAVIGSVNEPVAVEVEKIIRKALSCEVGKINRDISIPLNHTLDEPVTLGVDRAVCALAAWERSKQACVVIDAGTAITVDLIDGKGVFQGGAIIPGGGLMLAALHGGTDQLPAEAWPPKDASVGTGIGRTTSDAMMLGAMAAVRGAVRHLVEGFSELYGGYPMVIATGGDAPLFFDDDGLVEHVIPDLQLVGIRLCLAKARSEASE